MRIEQVKDIADAVLYEGYLLYPYRQSAIKNRQRWLIGVLYPREYSEANGSIEPYAMQTECLIVGKLDTRVDVYIRFLHLLTCTKIESLAELSQSALHSDNAKVSGRFDNDAHEEGIEREIACLSLPLHTLLAHPQTVEINFPASHEVEKPDGGFPILLVREQQAVAGVALISAEQLDEELFKLQVCIENRTPGTAAIPTHENSVHPFSFASTHTLLQVHEGSFVSLLEPPDALWNAAKQCKNVWTWPVLVGKQGEHDTVLSSPIYLYDYPQIAPESPGPLFDGTEIDEILSLRILTLSDEEKREIRQGDARAREILERTEALTPEQFMKMHGTIRSLRPLSEEGEP